jgi:hypothetical protein
MDEELANPALTYQGRYGDGIYDLKSAATLRHTIKPSTIPKDIRRPIYSYLIKKIYYFYPETQEQ